MVRMSKGFRSGTRNKLSKSKREKFTVERYIRKFEPNQRVVIHLDPSSHKGMPHPRFKGLIGVVKERRGRAYIVSVKTGRKEKMIIARPEHLKPAG